MGYKIEYFFKENKTSDDKSDAYFHSTISVGLEEYNIDLVPNDDSSFEFIKEALMGVQFIFKEDKLNKTPPSRSFSDGSWIKIYDKWDWLQIEWISKDKLKISASHFDTGKNIVFECDNRGISEEGGIVLDIAKMIMDTEVNVLCQEILDWVIIDLTGDSIIHTTDSMTIDDINDQIFKYLIAYTQPFIFMKMKYEDTENFYNKMDAFSSIKELEENPFSDEEDDEENESEEEENDITIQYVCNTFIKVIDKFYTEGDTTLTGLDEDCIGIEIDVQGNTFICISEAGTTRKYSYPEYTPAYLYDQGIIDSEDMEELEDMIKRKDSSIESEFELSKHEIDEAGIQGEEED